MFSIKDLNVKDPMPNAKAPVIVTKMEKHKDIMQLDVSCFVVMHTCMCYNVPIVVFNFWNI